MLDGLDDGGGDVHVLGAVHSAYLSQIGGGHKLYNYDNNQKLTLGNHLHAGLPHRERLLTQNPTASLSKK
eukprot:COSAG02_NODE_12602_length_1520_cov_2.282899_1_plen_69_part_10